MGKPKKGKKGRQDDEFPDDVDVDPIAQAAALENEASQPAAPSKGKKGKKKKKDDWDEDDVADEIAALALESEVNGKVDVPVPQPKQKKKKGKKIEEDSEDDSEAEDFSDDIMAMAKPAKKGKKQGKGGMASFQMLEIEEPDMSSNESNEDEPEPEPAKNKPPRQKSVEGDGEETKQTKKGKKDKKKGKKEDQDIDAILAGIEDNDKSTSKKGKKKKKDEKKEDIEETNTKQEVSSAAPVTESLEFVDYENMTQEQIAQMFEDNIDDEDYKKKKKKDKKKKQKVEEAEEDEVGDDEAMEDEEGGTVKTAAQKKKEKRERQKQQKLLENKKEKEKSKKKEEKSKAEQSSKTEEAPSTDATAAEPDKTEEKDEDEEGETKKSKKDKKKKKGEEKEEKKDKKKKPGSAQLKAMQEALARVKEEEERQKREEEEKQRKKEEAKRAKEEKEKRDQERKEKEKQKRKERIDKLKQEGKYLTPKQKEAQRRAQQMLEAMRAQGLQVPTKGADDEKKPKRVIYDNRRKKKPQQNSVTSPTEETKELSPETPSTPEVSAKEIVEEKVEEKEEEIKDAWDAEDEVKDEWDASSEEEEESENVTEDKAKVDEKEEATDEEEGSDESEEESDEESEESESSEESSDEESDDGMTNAERAREKALARMAKRHEDAEAKRTTDNLRSPVVCVLGHVDTGKTKILDKLRRTNVQDGEAGGITQQIGATNVPVSCIEEQTKMCKDFVKKGLKLPGLLIIDTPGHESFSNLRTRGSSLCDIAILVIDIMHGLEPQTIESINLLKKGKTPFIVALNKIDRLFQWQSNPHGDVKNTINKQKPNTKIEFEERAQLAITQLAEQGLNAALFYENKNPKEYISLVPTSAHSGDGMGNLIALICELSQTMLAKRLAYSEELQATVMEVKALPGLGMTIDVILVNGSVMEGETIVVAGTEGPIVTTIRGLLMPQPLKELRVKNAYAKHKEVKAAQGVKIIAKELDHALAGLPMLVAKKPDEVVIYKEEIGGAIKDILAGIRVQERGVFVQASTIGSLEALLEFLRTSKINYAGINIGPVHKKDIMRASVMLEHDSQYATILAFDVKVEREAQELADSLGVRIFCADIIYHLFDQFMAYRAEVKRKKQDEFKHIAVFPCKLRILPQFIFNTRDPIVVGVVVEAGFVKEGTPLCVPGKEFVEIGRVVSIENNHKNVDMAKRGSEVCIKIEPIPGDAPKMLGRHFDETDLLVSKISRQSIDAVKNYFREEMGKGDWQLIMELKKTFQIL